MRLFFGPQWCTSNKATHIRKGMKYKKSFFFTSRKQPCTVQIKYSPALAEHRASAKLSQTLHKHSQQNSLARPRRDIFAGEKLFPYALPGRTILSCWFSFSLFARLLLLHGSAVYDVIELGRIYAYFRLKLHLLLPSPFLPLYSLGSFSSIFFCSLIKPKKNTLSKKKTAWKKKTNHEQKIRNSWKVISLAIVKTPVTTI